LAGGVIRRILFEFGSFLAGEQSDEIYRLLTSAVAAVWGREGPVSAAGGCRGGVVEFLLLMFFVSGVIVVRVGEEGG
jgi:hypothetical protein